MHPHHDFFRIFLGKIEELVGEIMDEFDKEEDPIRPLGEGRYIIEGDLPIHTFKENLNLKVPDTQEDTIAGMIIESLEHVPRAGERVDFSGYTLTIREVENHRIKSVILSPKKKKP